jgi:hypothetical protein
MATIETNDLTEINELRAKLGRVVTKSGELSLQIKLLQADIREAETQLEEQSTEFKNLLNQEQELVKRLSEKYGTGSIDFETGEFTPEK